MAKKEEVIRPRPEGNVTAQQGLVLLLEPVKYNASSVCLLAPHPMAPLPEAVFPACGVGLLFPAHVLTCLWVPGGRGLGRT